MTQLSSFTLEAIALAGRSDINVTVTERVDVRRIRGTITNFDTFRATRELNRFSQYQMQVGFERAWVKTLAVEASITAPELTSLTSRVATLEATPAVTARNAAGVDQSEQYLVISGKSIIPLVAGHGCVIETVERTISGGLTMGLGSALGRGPSSLESCSSELHGP